MWLRLLSVLRGAGSVVDDSLSIVAAIVLWGFCTCVWSLFCCAVLSIVSSFALIFRWRRESWINFF